MKKKDTPVAGNEIVLIDENLLKNKVYTIRGVKVMLDADLAEIYGYETRAFNQQVKLNIDKFDDDFRFQLTDDEFKRLMSKNLTSKTGRGGTRKLPFVFTEQGIYMLMTVLRGGLATLQSKAIIRLFKDMKDYIAAENQQLSLNGQKLEADVACSAMNVVNGLHKVGRFVSTVVCKILAETARLLIYFRWRIIF